MSDVSSCSSPLCHGDSRDDWQLAHDQLKADSALWLALAFDGIQHDGLGELYEHRRCPRCGSTIDRLIDLEEATEICGAQTRTCQRSLEALGGAIRARTQPAVRR